MAIERQFDLAKRADEICKHLWELAYRLDGWAEQSRKGGWSTHQVEANLAAASECRRLGVKAMHLSTKLNLKSQEAR